jgi:hypothetical protein
MSQNNIRTHVFCGCYCCCCRIQVAPSLVALLVASATSVHICVFSSSLFSGSVLCNPVDVAGGAKSGGAAGGESLFSGTYRKGVIMGCILFVFQQFSGINAIVYFSSSVFKQVRGDARLGGGGQCVSGCQGLHGW